ncbi:MAG: tRNA uridine-5-carboxymethylaminomethyl(34) synthesis GTPase MnmE, partial [Flavobacteriaceae bacterium]|nr:tRNA uridine-5-carboxymethylaminomethyl(34) synthesis GTPase MnmE [Flavobacteriaceae bacterium]
MIDNDNIIALATASGSGAISIIRVSGPKTIEITDSLFKSKDGSNLLEKKSHTITLGDIVEGSRVIDEVLVSLFVSPKSYTGENVVEISCHGSSYVQKEIIKLFIDNGCRAAKAGEFTLRAFLNGKIDLSQAEAVADLISSKSSASHKIALDQMRGGFKSDIKELRQQLLDFASLIELELDFTEEDVEFANLKDLTKLIHKIKNTISVLIDSFATGNVIKNGIPIVIAGEPNTGKSTLLNAILNDDRAIVSDIPGTTRDTVEDELILNGINYRFIDTAGIRTTKDEIESIGISKTFEKIENSTIILYMLDCSDISSDKIESSKEIVNKIRNDFPDKKLLLVANKIDIADSKLVESNFSDFSLCCISAKDGTNL